MLTLQDYIWICLTDDIISQAEKKCVPNNPESFSNGEGSIYGEIAEICFGNIFTQYKRENTPDYDFINRTTGTRIDVKAKHITDFPMIDFDASIPKFAGGNKRVLTYDCDYFVFARVRKSLDVCWLIGMIQTKKFLENAILDPKMKQECYQMKYRDLSPLPRTLKGDPNAQG